jgi:glycosyltransferase involved in cell wall biosynthesis
MHVAYIHQHFSTIKGATGTRSYEMSKRLIRAGHRVTMVCGEYQAGDPASTSRERVNEMDVDGIRVLRVAEPYANRMSFVRRVLAFGRFARTAGGLVKRLDADLVLATSTPLTVGIPGMKAAKALNVPFVFEVRDLWPELAIALGVLKSPLLKWYTRRLERKIYFAAGRIIALAPGIREGICRTGYPADRVTMIPNSCDLDLFSPSEDKTLDDQFGANGDFRLVFAGAHGLANGLDSAIDAVAELKRRGATGIRFVFIGDGGQKPRLMERSRREGLAPFISWVSPIPKERFAEILPRMHVGLMLLKNVPSFYYGTSPNKFFDFLAAGLPILNNYPGWLADLITQHRCGAVVQPDNPVAFADAVLQLREQKEDLRLMGRRARQLGEAEFSRDALGARFVSVLESALDEPRAALLDAKSQGSVRADGEHRHASRGLLPLTRRAKGQPARTPHSEEPPPASTS